MFASEIKALLGCRGLEPDLDLEVLPEYLVFRNLSGERTFFRGIYALEPGSTLVWNQAKIRIKRYWSVGFSQGEEDRPIQEIIEELDGLLENSVSLRLMSEVPLGTYCSGGVDSSLLTAYTAMQCVGRLNTFSVGFEEPDFDESIHAQNVANKFGTVHHKLVIDEWTFAENLPKAIWLHDSPLNHANSVPLSSFSRERANVEL